MSILNTASSGRFSTDRTMRDYNDDIWHLEPIAARGLMIRTGQAWAARRDAGQGRHKLRRVLVHCRIAWSCACSTSAGQQVAAHDLPECTDGVWHGYLPGCRPGQHYGYRVHGPYDPAKGLRCNPTKLLIDPYARRLQGEFRWHGQCVRLQ